MTKDLFLEHSPAARQWQRIGIKHHHGIALPLSCLHSEKSHGIGEFTDLPLLIDWCASIGFDVIQLLPLNDTGEGTSPYSALSAFALNPIFIGINSLPFIQDHPQMQNELRAIPKFEASPLVEYARVRKHKERFLRHYFQVLGPEMMKGNAFEQFIHTASYWLKGYAAFKILKKRHCCLSWEMWEEKEKNGTSEAIESAIQQENVEWQWICFLQFLCFQQLNAAKAHAERRNVFLMGDIPILIDRDSADVWQHKEIFNLDYSAGAPPDAFSETGQNWGFPIYRWDTLGDQNFQWWKERLKYTGQFYHIYRIDHIVGFFRIWSFPSAISGEIATGCFIPKNENEWIDHGQKIMLMMLEASDMLPIGEDLGVIPPEVRICLNALGICGTRVMRWERKWNEGGGFIFPHNYLTTSLTTVSTHDTETLEQWWKNNREEAELFAEFKGWLYHPFLSHEHRREILWESHHSASLFHINLIQEYLSLIPGLSWPNPDDERINIPGIVADRNWRYRLVPSLEDLQKESGLNHQMQELIR